MSFKYLQVARIRGNYLLSQNILMLSFLYNNNNNIIINNSFINNIYIYICSHKSSYYKYKDGIMIFSFFKHVLVYQVHNNLLLLHCQFGYHGVSIKSFSKHFWRRTTLMLTRGMKSLVWRVISTPQSQNVQHSESNRFLTNKIN